MKKVEGRGDEEGKKRRAKGGRKTPAGDCQPREVQGGTEGEKDAALDEIDAKESSGDFEMVGS